MKQGNVFIFHFAWILICIFNAPMLYSQPYSGGDNSGAFAINTTVVNCFASRFEGAENSGSNALTSNTLNCVTERFAGDTAAGNTTLTTNLVDCSPIRFAGDSAEGFGNAVSSILNCSNERFAGDTSSGSAVMASSILDCTPARFFGDSSSGFATGTVLVIRRFLGEDTSLVLVCSNDTFNLFNLYNAPGLSYNWSTSTPTSALPGSYQLIATNAAGCVDTAMALLKQDIIKWTGAVSDNWHDAANWDLRKIPGEKTHVIIPAGTLNACIVKEADATAASLQAFGSGSFSIINNRVIVITGTCVSLPAAQ